MRILRIIFITAGLILILSLVSIGVYLQLEGKNILMTTFSHALNRSVTIESLYYHFPWGVSAHKIDIDGLGKIERCQAQIDLWTIVRREKVFSSLTLIKPEFVLKRKFIVPPMPPSDSDTIVPSETTIEKPMHVPRPSLRIRKITVKEGTVFYSEETDSSLAFHLTQINFKAHNLTLPLADTPINFKLFAKIFMENPLLSGSELEATGWINFPKKDMDSRLKISQSDGGALLTAHLVSQDNRMMVKGDLKINRLTQPSAPSLESASSPPTEDVQSMLFGTLANLGVGVGAQFSFETEMDNFAINNIAFSGNVVQ